MQGRSIAMAMFIGIVTVSAALESFAQFGGGTQGGGMRGSRGRPDGAAREQRPPVRDNSPEQIEDRLGMLEEDLHLTPGQQAAWQATEEKIIAYAADIGREQSRGLPGDATLNSIQQIDHTVDVARNRLTALEDIASAARTLYATLTAQQKSIFDPRLANIVSALANPARGGGPARPKRPL
jgi:hypothetical protein